MKLQNIITLEKLAGEAPSIVYIHVNKYLPKNRNCTRTKAVRLQGCKCAWRVTVWGADGVLDIMESRDRRALKAAIKSRYNGLKVTRI